MSQDPTARTRSVSPNTAPAARHRGAGRGRNHPTSRHPFRETLGQLQIDFSAWSTKAREAIKTTPGSISAPPTAEPIDREQKTLGHGEYATETWAPSWQSLGPALLAPAAPASSPPAQTQAGTEAALEHVVRSFRIGRTGKGGHEARLELRGALEGISVRLRQDGDRLTAQLIAEPAHAEQADRLAEKLHAATRTAGIRFEEIELCWK